MNDILKQIADFDKSTFVNGKIVDKRIGQIQKNHLKSSTKSLITTLKEFIKDHPKIYNSMVYLLSPSYPNKKPLKKFIKKYGAKVLINIGSGNTRIYPAIINLDLFDYKNVEIVTDATDMCLKNDSVDGVISIANLEHIKDPEKTVKEINRVLKTGGECFLVAPFIYGFHASPNDFTRWTHEGLKNIFERNGFETVKTGIATGPTSAILTIATEYFAILFSFGIKFLYEILLIFFMLILWPLKFLDFILRKIPFSINIASSIYIIARKK